MNNKKLKLAVDLRWISLGLLLIIFVMLVLWRPWHREPASNARTISVTGESTLKAAPDEYSFTPSYDFKESDKATAIKDASDKQTEVVNKLKDLGVLDKDIQTNIDGYGDDVPVLQPQVGVLPPVTRNPDTSYTYTLSLTVTVSTRDVAQKVQNYLATTSPDGTVTPSADFSDALRTKLESQARDTATKDARSKADQSARNLGFKVGSVKSVDDSNGFNGGGGIVPLQGDLDTTGSSSTSDSPNIAIQPGQNDLSYSVTVVYYIR